MNSKIPEGSLPSGIRVGAVGLEPTKHEVQEIYSLSPLPLGTHPNRSGSNTSLRATCLFHESAFWTRFNAHASKTAMFFNLVSRSVPSRHPVSGIV